MTKSEATLQKLETDGILRVLSVGDDSDDSTCSSCGYDLDETDGEHHPDCGNHNHPTIDEDD